jgi:hypothetical protein
LAGPVLVATASAVMCGVGVSGAAVSAHASSVPPFCFRLSLAKIGTIVGGSVTLLETSLSTLSGAEKTAQANFPAGLTITFAGVPSSGPTVYSWSAKIDGTPYVGLNTNEGSVGYYIEMQGAPKLSVLEKLIKYEIATK